MDLKVDSMIGSLVRSNIFKHLFGHFLVLGDSSRRLILHKNANKRLVYGLCQKCSSVNEYKCVILIQIL